MKLDDADEFMANLCADNNCSEEDAKKHQQIYRKRRWAVHPSRAFKAWWEPNGFSPNGASKGGHTSAKRCWVKKETGERRWYGIDAETAFNSEGYREEFRQWLRFGMNPEWHNWDSTTAPEQEMGHIIRQCMEEIAKGVFPVAPVTRTDYKPGQEP